MFISTVVECVIISFYLILRMMWRETDRLMLPQIGNWITILVMLTNIITYNVKKLKKKFRLANAISMGLLYIVVMFITDATFIYWILVGILLMNLPFYDWKYSKKAGYLFLAQLHCQCILPAVDAGRYVKGYHCHIKGS